MNITTLSRRTHVVLTVAVVLLLLISVNSAAAHARLVKSSPENTARLPASPAQVELQFNELLDDGFNTIEVFPIHQLNADKHDNFATGTPQVDPKDRTRLTVAVAPLKPGTYIVSYRVLSRDGHTAPGRFSFNVLPPETKPETK